MTLTEIGERFLLDQIPMKHRRLIAPKLKLAYEAVTEHVEANPFLQIPSAADNRGRLRSWAVDFAIQGLIESQEWPVDYRWQVFAKPTGRYLEVILPHSTLSISQVTFWQEQPRDVEFRHNARLSNYQFDLLDGDKAGVDLGVANGPIALLLVHGHQELEFAHIGVPHANGGGYMYQTPNILRLLHEAAPPDVPRAEGERSLDELMSLKEQIERWQKDNGEL